MTDVWTLVFATVIGDKTIDQFECEISKITKYIGKSGSLQAKIDVPAIEATSFGMFSANTTDLSQRLEPIIYGAGKFSVYAYYGNTLWWGGFLSEVTISGSRTGTTVDISAISWEGVLDRLIPVDVYQTFTSIEQLDLAAEIWKRAQSPTRVNAQFGIDIQTYTPSGVKRDLSWRRSTGSTWATILNEMANRENGFEWLVNVYSDGVKRHRDVIFGYPSIKRQGPVQQLMYPGNIQSYQIKSDLLAGATSFQARGTAEQPIGSEVQEPILSDIVELDWPKTEGLMAMDFLIDRNSVSRKDTLNSWAIKYALTRTGPYNFPSIKCDIESLNDGSIIGQSIRLSISDQLFHKTIDGKPGYVQEMRVIGFEIDPKIRGQLDSVSLILEDPRMDL